MTAKQDKRELFSYEVGRFLEDGAEEISGRLPYGTLEEMLWEILNLCQGQEFQTAKGLRFAYYIKGNEMFVSRKDKSLTRATVQLAFRTALALQRRGEAVSGPKKLGTFGASYLYPIFIELGIIRKR